MVYPTSVRGALVTEGVRGEGGILKNAKGERFMFRYVPDMYKGEFAETEEEAKKWLDGDQKARRPPELLTRDVVAKAIDKEVKEGRGTVHGGVFLDIASQRSADYILRKLPSMHHQFKTLANLDITKEPMEIGPTTHYVMGGIRVDPDTQETKVKGLFACGESAGGMHGANRLGGNSLSDLLVFGKIAGEEAAKSARQKSSFDEIDMKEITNLVNYCLEPFNDDKTENPYQLQSKLQEIMQTKIGMIRDEQNIKLGIQQLEELQKEIYNAHCTGDRNNNTAWHTCIS